MQMQLFHPSWPLIHSCFAVFSDITFFGTSTRCTDAPTVSPGVAISVALSYISSPTFAIWQTASHINRGNFVSHRTLIFGLHSCCCHFCVSCQYSQPVRVQPWQSRMVLLRRTLLLQRCTPTLWWDPCRRRTRRMRSKGRPTCSWRKRRLDPCHHPLVAQTAPTKWDLTTLMGPCTI